MNNYIFYLILFTIVSSFLDFSTNKFYKKIWAKKNKEQKNKILFYLFLHNILYYCIYFSLFFILYYRKSIDIKYVYYYLLILILVPIHWITNNNKCWFTVQQNKLLEIDENYGFRDPYLILTNSYTEIGGENNIRDKIYYYYLISAIVIVTYLIIQKKYPKL